MPSSSIMPWYCGGPYFISDRFESCIPSAAQQEAIFRGNFGPSADPRLIDEAAKDLAGYLSNSNYDTTIQSFEQQDRENPFGFPLGLDYRGIILPLVIGVGAVIIIKLVKGR